MLLRFESIIIILVSIFCAVFLAFYFYFTRNFKFWHKLGIPYVKPTPFVGNLRECAFQKLNIGEKLQQIYNEHSDKPYVGIFSFDKPSLMIRDLDIVKNVLVKDSQLFIDRVVTFNENSDPLYAMGLPFIKDQRWRQMRTKLTPMFTSGKVKKMFYLVDSCGKELADCLDRATAEGSTVDVKETVLRYTTDVMGSCVFGIDGHSLKDPQSEFRYYLRNIFDFSLQKGLATLTAFCAPKLTSLLNLKFVEDDTTNYLRKTVWSTVEYREKNGSVRNDIFDHMMELRNKGKEGCQEGILSAINPKTDATFQIDGDEFVAQNLMFLVGGYETSGSTLFISLYEIALQPEIQKTLRSEILGTLNRHNGELTYDGIQEMSYLDMVVSETLRKYPILPFLDRMCSIDYELPAPSGNGTVTLPAGTAVYIPLLGIQNDPTYFPEPEKFDPDRFTEENKQTRTNYTYIPFGNGPRICIGTLLGLLQVKTALCHILSRFEVVPCKDTPVSIVFDPRPFLLTVKGDLPLSFKRLHH